MSDDDEHDENFELIMPFVTVTSKGGPHDDDSYTAGWAMGTLDHILTVCAVSQRPTFNQVIRLDSVPQAELIAMKHGYVMTVNVYDDEFWAGVTFTDADGYPSVTEEP